MTANHSYAGPANGLQTRRATTLVELCVVLGLLAALFSIALPRLRDASDRAAARGAIQEASSLFSIARQSAITRRAVVAVVIDTLAGTITARTGTSEIAEEGLRASFGVRVVASRDSMSYDPRGLGYGAANLSIVAKRGRAAETLFVSRLGRTRH
jgi:type II secretory pathway pseudopilin PulG